MNINHRPRPTLALLAAAALALLSGGCTTSAPAPQPQTQAHTPAKDSPERKAILAAARAPIEKMLSRKVVLVVHYLKVHYGWAWLTVAPQSQDSTEHFESLSGLFEQQKGQWTLKEWMPSEEGTNEKTYFKKVKAKYPSAPHDIFPQ